MAIRSLTKSDRTVAALVVMTVCEKSARGWLSALTFPIALLLCFELANAAF